MKSTISVISLMFIFLVTPRLSFSQSNDFMKWQEISSQIDSSKHILAGYSASYYNADSILVFKESQMFDSKQAPESTVIKGLRDAPPDRDVEFSYLQLDILLYEKDSSLFGIEPNFDDPILIKEIINLEQVNLDWEENLKTIYAVESTLVNHPKWNGFYPEYRNKQRIISKAFRTRRINYFLFFPCENNARWDSLFLDPVRHKDIFISCP